MSDPRNVAHDKKVKQEKEDEKPAVKPKKGRGKKELTAPQESEAETAAPAKAEQAPGDAEKSAVVLSKLKEMEFHSRANIETLAGLTMTIEDELHQKDFAAAIEAVYSAQNGFETKLAALIESYAAMCETLKAE